MARLCKMAFKLGGGREINGLVHVVLDAVVAIAVPGLEYFFFLAAGEVAERKGQGGNALLDEAVLVAADEAIAVRLLVGLHFDASGFGHTARTSSPRVDSLRPWTSSHFKGKSGRNMSMLRSATMRPWVVGWWAKKREPSSPFSSPVTARNRREWRVETF